MGSVTLALLYTQGATKGLKMLDRSINMRDYMSPTTKLREIARIIAFVHQVKPDDIVSTDTLTSAQSLRARTLLVAIASDRKIMRDDQLEIHLEISRKYINTARALLQSDSALSALADSIWSTFTAGRMSRKKAALTTQHVTEAVEEVFDVTLENIRMYGGTDPSSDECVMAREALVLVMYDILHKSIPAIARGILRTSDSEVQKAYDRALKHMYDGDPPSESVFDICRILRVAPSEQWKP